MVLHILSSILILAAFYISSTVSQGTAELEANYTTMLSDQCTGNLAGEYPCSEVDLTGFLSVSNMEGTSTNKLNE